jgi:hypothetical protein
LSRRWYAFCKYHQELTYWPITKAESQNQLRFFWELSIPWQKSLSHILHKKIGRISKKNTAYTPYVSGNDLGLMLE